MKNKKESKANQQAHSIQIIVTHSLYSALSFRKSLVSLTGPTLTFPTMHHRARVHGSSNRILALIVIAASPAPLETNILIRRHGTVPVVAAHVDVRDVPASVNRHE